MPIIPADRYRVGVGETAKATEWVDAEFGTTLSRVGFHSDEEVRNSTEMRQAMELQLENEKIYVANFEKIASIKKQIEALRLKAITAGLAEQQEIAKMIGQLLVDQAKHQQKIETMGHKAGLDVRLTEMKGADARERNVSAFEMKLQRVAQLGASKLEELQVKFQQQDAQMAQSKQRQMEYAQRRQSRTEWLTGRSNDRPQAVNAGRNPARGAQNAIRQLFS